MFRFISKVQLLLVLTPLLFSCDEGQVINAVETNQSTLKQLDNNHYLRLQKQANLGEFQYTDITAEQFISEYFLLSNQVSSTEFMLSDEQHFTIPADTVSFSLNFNNIHAGKDLFIGELESPSGIKFSLWDHIPCFDGTCSMVIPNRNDGLYRAEAGEWTYRVVAEKTVVESKSLDSATINLLIRVNSQFEENKIATIPVQPYYTGSTTTSDDINAIMSQFVHIFRINGIAIDWQAAIHVPPNEFSIMQGSYADPKTKALMQYGKTDAVNIYFIDAFKQQDELTTADAHPGLAQEVYTLLGIAAGIPGSLGTQGDANGVMVSLQSLHDENKRNNLLIAATAAHEVGHFLGLFHTTELSGIRIEPLSDTPYCELTENKELPTDDSCPDVNNLMFPVTRSDGMPSIELTNDQLFILKTSPLAY